MGAYVFPADAVSGAPSYTGKMARLTLGAAFAKDTARPVGARSGIHPATPDSVFSVSGTTWTVQPHCGVLDTEASATNGPYGYAFDTNQTGSVNAADATNPRWDLLSVQLSDPAAGDGTSTPGVAIVYTAGTAAASPSLPATPARSLALARITVPQSGGGASSTTVLAPYMASAAGVVRCRTSTEYPASPYVGQYVDDATVGLLRWSGAAWLPVSPFTLQAVGTAAVGGTPPAVASGTFNVQAGSNPVTYVTGGVTMNFPVSFANGLLTVVMSPGDITGTPFYQIGIDNSGTTKAHVKFKAATNAGAEMPNAQVLRVNFFAVGW